MAQQDPHREACGATDLEHMEERKVNSPNSWFVVFEAPGVEVKNHPNGGKQRSGLNYSREYQMPPLKLRQNTAQCEGGAILRESRQIRIVYTRCAVHGVDRGRGSGLLLEEHHWLQADRADAGSHRVGQHLLAEVERQRPPHRQADVDWKHAGVRRHFKVGAGRGVVN